MRALARIFSLATVAFSALVLQACNATDSSVGGSNQDNLNAECKPGESKKADDGCNTCSCQQNGFWACTEMACGGQNECKPGDTKKADCNTCSCMANGQWACTAMACGAACKTDNDCGGPTIAICDKCADGTEVCMRNVCTNGTCGTEMPSCNGGTCKPGETKKADDGCNTCSCTPDGQWACTEKGCIECTGPMPDCAAPPPGCDYVGGGCVNGSWTCGDLVCENACQPGETKKADDGCNTCSCTPDGQWACTTMDCGCDIIIDCAAPPPGCDYVGGGCINGSWTCGTLVCAGSCEPQDAVGVGDCDAFFGFAWNGKECVGLGGCNCKGADCGNTYSSIEACAQAHVDCGSGIACKADSDCPAPPPVCEKCADGSEQCATVSCVAGQCLYSGSSCGGGIGPGLPCGKPGAEAPADDGCNTCVCGPDGVWGCTKMNCVQCDGPPPPCVPPPEGCDYVNSGCVNGQWTCGDLVCGNQCKSSADCAQPGAPCQICPDGSTACPSVDCVNGQCVGSFPGCPSPASCDPQDAQGVGFCAAFLGYAWNGNECVGIGGCDCAGADCGSLYKTGDECKLAHESCSSPPPPVPCKIDSDCPQPNGPCVKCLGINPCAQSVCDSGACVYVPPTCGDSCEPQDAVGVGDCDAFFGFAWNGKECVGLGGCNCKGADCGNTYESKVVCEAIHNSCQ